MNAMKNITARMLKNTVTRKAVLLLTPVVGMTGLAAAPASAHTHWSLNFHFFFPVTPVYVAPCDAPPAPCPPPAPAVDPNCPPPAPCPAPQPVWVPPVYQTVVQTVWIPPHTEYRTVEHHERHRDWVETIPVFVPGHYEQQASQVLVCPGHWQ